MAENIYASPVAARTAFAERVEAGRADILADYCRHLEEIRSPFSREPGLRKQAMDNAGEILTDVTRCVRAGKICLDRVGKSVVCDVEETPGAHCLHVREEMRAASALFQAAIHFAARQIVADEESLPFYAFFALALNWSINMRTREAANAYTGFLLNKVHEAHTAERYRIARELHDRTGRVLRGAGHQLELYVDHQTKGRPMRTCCPVDAAQRSIVESMKILRRVTGDLRRQEPRGSLEKALAACIESAPPEVTVRLRVSGDETWVPPAIRDESFFVIRQAICDALADDSPTMLLIGVDIVPGELRMWVEGGGCGLDAARDPSSCTPSLGPMQERVAMMGGTITVSAERNRRVLVELLVPLPGICR